ncbi:MAG: hypothetical protein GXO79_01905 [Chlorobi bacterium]|nr:hypothetical protein [Chlorobiota bacterium]
MARKNIPIYFVFFLLSILKLEAQDTTSSKREDALNIFIDCNWCDESYFKQNFSIVNYVRDRKVADVHLILTEIKTGSGGIEYSIHFIGQNKYKALEDTVTFSLPADYTKDEERKLQLENIKWGLVPYILKTPFANKLSLKINNEQEIEEEVDKWNHWVMELTGSGWYNGDKTYLSTNWRTAISVRKVTDEVKFESKLRLRNNNSLYRFYEGDTLISTTRSFTKGYGWYNIYVKSLGNHWGVGGFLNGKTESYSNLDFQLKIKPAIEYNLFDYAEATNKQLRFLYSVGYIYNMYTDTTIYNKMEEKLLQQSFSVNFNFVKKWGSVEGSVYASQYLHDLSLFNAGIYGGGRIRLFKGLSLRMWGGIQFPHDQITLIKSETTTEEVLLRQYELETDYSFWGNMGLSYTIGSIYNNTVNPRFDE